MRILANKYNGIWLPDLKIALDCRKVEAEAIFVSHAHSDHVPSNSGRGVFATHVTGLLMQRRGFKGAVHGIDFFETIDLPTARVTLFPAGHILGSAMVFIESDEGSILYTGDYKTPPSPASDGFQLPEKPIDYLITEATFGLPLYRWKSHEELFDEIRRFTEKTISEGDTPVFLAYSLGKSQELLMALAPLNYPVQVHDSCYPLCEVYRDAGLDMGIFEHYNPEISAGSVLIVPSNNLKDVLNNHQGKKRVAYVSGWAALEARGQRMNVDKLIPLSDHIDFFELTSLCERLNPKRVYITHTPDPKLLCYWLEQRGIAGGSPEVGE